MYILPQLANIEGFVHAFSTLNDEGNQGFGFADPDEAVYRNRELFFQHVSEYRGVPVPIERAVSLVPLQPGHEDTIIFADESFAGRGIHARLSGPHGEAIITDSDVPLFLPTADCFPVIMVDIGEHLCHALVHDGLKASIAQIPAKTVRAMTSKYGTDPVNLVVGFGPGIHQRAYKVEHFEGMKIDPRWERFIEEVEGGMLVNIRDYSIMMLVEDCKIPRENISVSAFDTYVAKDRFSSHRRAKDTGESETRFATVSRIVR